MAEPATRWWRRSRSAYTGRYRAAFRHPFGLLSGQLLTFFAISVYVKLMEMRDTAEYGAAWVEGGRLLANSLHSILFCGQEICLFGALLMATSVWRHWDPSGRGASRYLAWMLALVVLPVLSLVEVLGLAHFELFLTPLGPEEVRVIAWAGHVVTASNVLQLPEVCAGLLFLVVGYYLVPCAIWLSTGPWRLPRAAAVLLIGALVASAPKPIVADAVLVPHPLVWLLFGGRPDRIWPETPGVAAISGAPASRARFSVRQRPTNVLLFVLESTRADSVALYNPAAPAGRDLLRFRDETVVFDHVYAPVPTSAHALFAILYGVYPYLGPFWSSAGKTVVADSMAPYFARAGFQTHFYVTSELDYDNVRSFAAPGFQRVLDPADWPGQEAYVRLPWGRDDRLLTEEIKRFLAAPRSQPFFLLAMTSNPHHPYALDHLPEAPADAEPQAAYERLVDYDLRLLAELYQWMKQRGIAEHTLLLVLGDHGEAFGEHAGNFGHAAFIYEENVHIPCFILHPRRLGLPRRIAQLGSQVDLRATILDILGRHDSAPTDGMSLLREDPGRMVTNFTENGVSRFGLRDASYSYIYTPHAVIEHVFDRRKDPREAHDLAEREPSITARYRSRLQHWEAAHELSLARVLQ